ncbi:hypothetical protein Bca52824_019513 [Brassica carinata]|uniref:Uncharacterized protein n=1 Tax=Brassica carinata TaxID=52824 RepID=A0A8X7VS50_BRACI|nr:hypothetical protein Bca52824_019513 [Brassica carinata]
MDDFFRLVQRTQNSYSGVVAAFCPFCIGPWRVAPWWVHVRIMLGRVDAGVLGLWRGCLLSVGGCSGSLPRTVLDKR